VKQYSQKKEIPDADKVNVILDSGCGTGKSTFILGQMHPNCVVIGIDQSIARLSRNKSYNQTDLCNQKRRNDRYNNFSNTPVSNHQDDQSNNQNDNVLLLRAELSDFWKCCLSSNQWQEKICIYKHYLLYPNPYPKKSRLKSRFYAHPAFPLLMMTVQMDGGGGFNVDGLPTEKEKEKLVVRSNWKGYLNEFKSAVGTWDDCGGSFMHWKKTFLEVHTDAEGWYPNEESCAKFESSGPYRLDGNVKEEAMTNFEAKYLDCGEAVYELSIRAK
jgi:tRNA G46 methylase TrmB